MKLNKIFAYLMLGTAAAAALTACDKDGDTIYTDGPDDTTLDSSATDIVLSLDHLQDLALTVYWNENGDIVLSDPLVEAPDKAVTNTLQFSTDETFATCYEDIMPAGVYYRQYTHEQLNNITSRLAMQGGVKADLYLRVKSSVGINIDPRYSNVKKYTITPYFIDKTFARVLDKDRNDTGRILLSPDANGIYAGFIGAGAWENWWLMEGDNTTWGNLGEDGKSFYASSDASSWNFWYPAPAGCYYTTVNTVEGWWSALNIETLTVSGDITGEMTFNRAANQWTLPVELPAAGTVSITVAGQASLYDINTTADGPGVAQTVGFGGSADALTFGKSGSAVTVTLPAGQTNLVLNLSDPHALKLGAGDVPDEPEAAPQLFFSGLVTWDGFDDYLTLYDANAKLFGGAHYINSEWGYRVYATPDWNDAYKAADDATPLSGSLVKAESDGNVPAPEPGLYVMDFDMAGLTYKLTAVTSVSYTGFNDDWNLTPMTASADNPEVFTGEFVKSANTPWGAKIIINDDWGLFFGGGELQGTLYLGHSDATSGFTGDNELETGATYILTVDLGRQTYTFTKK